MLADVFVTIWVGVKSNVLKQLPSDMLDEFGDIVCGVAEEKVVIAKYGFLPTKFQDGKGVCGVGVEVFYHNWNCGVVIFDTDELKQRIDEEIPRIKAVFEACGITEPVGVWCLADYE